MQPTIWCSARYKGTWNNEQSIFCIVTILVWTDHQKEPDSKGIISSFQICIGLQTSATMKLIGLFKKQYTNIEWFLMYIHIIYESTYIYIYYNVLIIYLNMYMCIYIYTMFIVNSPNIVNVNGVKTKQWQR